MKTGLTKWLAMGSLSILGLGVAGCAPLIVGSVAGSLDLAAYEYTKARPQTPTTPQSQPGAQEPKLTLNDIE